MEKIGLFPRRKLIIKIFSSQPSSEQQSHEINTRKDSRAVVSKVCELNNKKGYYAMTIWVDTDKNPSSESCVTHSRTQMTTRVNTITPLKTNTKEGVECKKRKVQHVTMIMDNCKKMQCWTMLKRLMVGRDAWALKKPILDPKVSYVPDKSEAIRKPKGLEDIESKLKNRVYSEIHEFVDDVRLVLSYALQYPQRSEVYRTATRISESFEMSLKRMEERWMHEERERKKLICKRELNN